MEHQDKESSLQMSREIIEKSINQWEETLKKLVEKFDVNSAPKIASFFIAHKIISGAIAEAARVTVSLIKNGLR